MDFFVLLIIAGVGISILGTLTWWVIVFLLARAAFRALAHTTAEFQGMTVQQQLATLQHLQAIENLNLGRQYMGSVEGPVTSQIRGMAASEGISLDF